MLDLSLWHFSEAICPVDMSELIPHARLAAFTYQPTENKPQRVFSIPPQALPVIHAVCQHFPCDCIASEVVLSRMMPGQSHGYHVDRQNTDWLTRVHVPLLTNDRSWLMFEDNGEKLKFAVGSAYTFNAERRHAFANEGETPRVHLIFDVLRR